MKFVDHLVDTYFCNDRKLYSPVFIAGVCEALLAALEEREEVIPHKLGSVEGDAFIAGVIEGHAVWQRRNDIELTGALKAFESEPAHKTASEDTDGLMTGDGDDC